MAANKAFKSIDTDIISSSDFIEAKKQLVKYKTIENAVQGKYFNKLNKWNRNVKVGYCDNYCEDEDCGEGKEKSQEKILISAFSYEEFLDISKGKKFANPVLNGSTNSDTNLYIGPFANVTFGTIPEDPCTDQSDNLFNKFVFLYPYNTVDDSTCSYVDDCITEENVNKMLFPNVGQADSNLPWGSVANPGFIFDPYARLYQEDCQQVSFQEGDGKIKKRKETTILDYRWFIEYWQVVVGNSLNGFSFPSKINFNSQYTKLSEFK